MSNSNQGEHRPDAARPDPRAEALRVLVVDDSAYNRKTLTDMIESDPGIIVVGRAIDGREALQAVFDLEPDVITLDLEMPKMDGFSFLRLLMARKPTPVIVISSHSAHSTVFRALELGAMDFLAKPGRQIGPELRGIQGELIRKIRLVRRLQAVRLQRRAESLARQRDARDTREIETLTAPDDEADGDEPKATSQAAEVETARAGNVGELEEPGGKGAADSTDAVTARPRVRSGPSKRTPPLPVGVVGIAASTGGPPAVQQILCALSGELPVAILVAQHMPARFTRAFASRLDKMCSLRVLEARDRMPLRPGVVYIAPGAANIEVERDGTNGEGYVRVRQPEASASAKITPSGDMLLGSGARLFQRRFCAVVLTGMGADGRDGATLAREHGSPVFAEDPSSAVMPGMPQSVIDAGVVDEVHSLDDLPAAIQRFADTCQAAESGRSASSSAHPGSGAHGRESGRV